MIYLQIAAFLLLAPLGILLGVRLSRHRFWAFPAIAAFAVVGLVIIGHRWMWASFFEPVRWAIDADVCPPLMTFVVGLLLSILIPKLTTRRARIAVSTLLGFSLVYFGLLPAILPMAARPALAGVKTQVDGNGVCHQTTAYTCGPAAAITCLNRLGLHAAESDLALAARTSPAYGTDPRLLAAVLNERYAEVHANYRWIGTLDALPIPAITECVMPRIGGHYLAVLEVTAEEVIVGDPLSGRQRINREEFLQWWKGSAIVVQRVQNPQTTGAADSSIDSTPRARLP